MTSEKPPKIAIIIGAARSGSTLAGMLLGQSGHFAYAGELNHFWDRGLGLDHLCGCGSHVSKCDFWHRVISTAGISDVDGLAQFRKLRKLLAQNYSINPFGGDRNTSSEDEIVVRNGTRALYEAIASITGRNWILDGAKQPIYARFLIDLFGPENVHVIHLVRDPRGVAFSAAKTREKTDTGKKGDLMVKRSPSKSAVNWLKVEYSALRLRREAGSYHLIRYEDLCARGPVVIDEVLDQLCLRPNPGQAVNSKEPTAHTVSGNPIRMGGMPTQKIQIDDGWRREMKISDKILVSMICSAGLLHHRYSFR